MKYLRRIVVTLFLAVALVAGSTGSTSAANFDTGNSRTNIQLRDDESVVTNVERAYSAVRVTLSSIRVADGTGRDVSGEFLESLERLEAANATLQEHSFHANISSQYSSGVTGVKTTAQALTDTASEIGSDITTREQVIAAEEALSQPAANFEAAVTSLEEGAANYSPSNTLPIIIIVTVVLSATIFITILVVRQNKKHAKAVFSNNPDAVRLTPEQKKLVVRLYRDIPLYDTAVNNQNADVAQALEAGPYKAFFERTDQDSFGSFAGYGYELRALVNIRQNNLEQALSDAQKAYQLYGTDKFTSPRVRQLALQSSVQN
jgi:hypothetical protein